MNEKELKLRRCELDVQEQESRLKDAKIELDEGYKKLKAEFDKEYAKLKNAYERELIKLERERAYALNAKEELERGYET